MYLLSKPHAIHLLAYWSCGKYCLCYSSTGWHVALSWLQLVQLQKCTHNYCESTQSDPAIFHRNVSLKLNISWQVGRPSIDIPSSQVEARYRRTRLKTEVWIELVRCWMWFPEFMTSDGFNWLLFDRTSKNWKTEENVNPDPNLKPTHQSHWSLCFISCFVLDSWSRYEFNPHTNFPGQSRNEGSFALTGSPSTYSHLFQCCIVPTSRL